MLSFEERVKALWENEQIAGRCNVLAASLGLLSFPYRAAVALRNGLYDQGVLRQSRLPCPVISVGNITVGGTGKTPTVILLANLLRERGRRPAVLSRGYGGSAKDPVTVVSDGNSVLPDWRLAGDEPVLIAAAAPGIPVLTGRERLKTGWAAIKRFGADCLLLDDAFQHRALHRDLDIVLIDAAHPFGNGRLLPRGPLREPPASLQRAHLFIRTGAEKDPPAPLGSEAGQASFRGSHCPQGLVEGATGRLSPPDSLRGLKVCAFAGIGRPDAFRKSLIEAGAEVVSFRNFPDHHPYCRPELDGLLRLAAESGAERIVTTEKDAIRLADFPDFLRECLLLRIGMEITPSAAFAALLFERLLY